MDKLKVATLISILLASLACTSYKSVPDRPVSNLETHLSFLASDEMQGRYPGTDGDLMASRYIEKYFNLIGLESGKQEFSFIRSVKRGPDNSFLINENPASAESYSPFGFSFDTLIKAQVVFAGYGITDKVDSFEWDDYKGCEIKGRWIMALRGTPDIKNAADHLSLASEDRDKAMLAADNGAAGLILVSGYNFNPED
ncbi:MAG TPA: hypothetical protein VHI78_07365, partial [Bacteroidales bacterium]|nr:hypothetical protein [Bacteroidales bacterium]